MIHDEHPASRPCCCKPLLITLLCLCCDSWALYLCLPCYSPSFFLRTCTAILFSSISCGRTSCIRHPCSSRACFKQSSTTIDTTGKRGCGVHGFRASRGNVGCGQGPQYSGQFYEVDVSIKIINNAILCTAASAP
ncbi:hypothetical protein JB92DRAFT_2929874 [Gautieria morchelliformis]|nr:hypothetical protein JB92DRAFT_2929874 [Gautieria morchelliformis]